MPPKVDDKKNQSSNETLYSAVEAGNMKKFDELLAAGADVNLKNSASGFTPLILAVQKGQFDMAVKLIKAKCDIYVEITPHQGPGKENMKESALTYAAHGGNEGIVNLLIQTAESNKKPFSDDQMGRSLRLAAVAGHRPIVKALISNGVNKTYLNVMPLFSAMRGGHNELLQELLAGPLKAFKDDYNSEGNTPVIFAALMKGDKDMTMFKILVEAGADLEKLTRNEESILDCIVENSPENLPEILKFLTEKFSASLLKLYGKLPDQKKEKDKSTDTPAIFHPAPKVNKPGEKEKIESSEANSFVNKGVNEDAEEPDSKQVDQVRFHPVPKDQLPKGQLSGASAKPVQTVKGHTKEGR